MKTVAIVGKAPNFQFPEGVERWGINNLALMLPNGWNFDAWDRWFDVHTRGHILKHRAEAWRWYRSWGSDPRPIYMVREDPLVPASVAYPFDRVQQAFAWGGDVEEFFTSSVDYMLALAILEGFERIELYGVDMWDAPHERGVQRNGAHYWIGIARGRGIDVHIPDESSLCKIERMYGRFTITGPRNFSSMDCTRFLSQVRRAREMEQAGYVEPGADEAPEKVM